MKDENFLWSCSCYCLSFILSDCGSVFKPWPQTREVSKVILLYVQIWVMRGKPCWTRPTQRSWTSAAAWAWCSRCTHFLSSSDYPNLMVFSPDCWPSSSAGAGPLLGAPERSLWRPGDMWDPAAGDPDLQEDLSRTGLHCEAFPS